ncbi:MAG: Rieske (2Fe-2S) protein [Acidimicrobiales bacterium mtb01]|nr:Rieske 2Fe-2S domain-containing protein [Actinomycetota bacterium]TEX45292.1 MAG: Rieske (2Fe-2S) protein [Acidimicrobiales bacterium mtb01]
MPRALAARWYSDHDQYQIERRAIWGTDWLMFGVTAELAQPGQYVADEIAGYPLLVVVDPDGGLRGFHNVCPHRAGVIQWPGCGKTGNLVCRYHGWAFAWDGSLKSARDFGEVPSVDEHSLRPIRVETWGPLVFVNLDENAPSLASTLGSLDGAVRQHDFSTFSYGMRVTRTLECNWKTYVDNYLEGYHVPLLHPLLNSAVDMKTYTVEVPDETYCIHRAGQVDGSASAGVWVFRYPNLAINVYSDGMNIERIVPLSSTRTAVVYDYFAHDTSEEKMASMVEMSNVTLDEDQTIAELVQRNLDAGVYEAGPLSPRHENALAWFQQRVRQSTGAR